MRKSCWSCEHAWINGDSIVRCLPKGIPEETMKNAGWGSPEYGDRCDAWSQGEAINTGNSSGVRQSIPEDKKRQIRHIIDRLELKQRERLKALLTGSGNDHLRREGIDVLEPFPLAPERVQIKPGQIANWGLWA